MKTLLDFLSAPKKQYDAMLEPICEKYSLSCTELCILMFLGEHSGVDTAKDILLFLPFTKSHVSMTVRSLEDKGYLKGEYRNGNRRTIHLILCDKADGVLKDALKARDDFQNIMLKGFNNKEKDMFKDFMERIFVNVKNNAAT